MKYVAFHVEKVALLRVLLKVSRIDVLFFLIWNFLVVILAQDVLFAMILVSVTILLTRLDWLVLSFTQKYVVFNFWVWSLLLHFSLF